MIRPAGRWKQPSSAPRRPSGRPYLALCVSSLSLMLLFAYSRMTRESTQQTDGGSVPKFVPYHGPIRHKSAAVWFNDKQAVENSNTVTAKRALYLEHSCRAASDTEIDWFLPQNQVKESAGHATHAIKPCMLTLLDFDAEAGDSLGAFIDAGISPKCNGRYSVQDGKVRVTPSTTTSGLTTWTRTVMEKYASSHVHSHKGDLKPKESLAQPENYCYFGVEGKPEHTDILAQIQQRVLVTTPRPLRSVRFWTEAVATKPDDGSTHTARTLTTILQETVQRHAGAHVLIRIGSVSPSAMIDEAYHSGVLCEYVASGVRIDMRVELTAQATKGDTMEQRTQFPLEKLKECGCNIEVANAAG